MNNLHIKIKCDRFTEDCVMTIHDYLKNNYNFTIIDYVNDFSLLKLNFLTNKFVDKYGNSIETYSTITIPQGYIYNTAIISDKEKFNSFLSSYELQIFKNTYPFLEISEWGDPHFFIPFRSEDRELINNYLSSIDKIVNT
jgi:hypothetical protein